jgi:predicted small metal-binding protein
MKEFRCDAVVPACPTVSRGESERAIFALGQSHAQDTHRMYEVPREVVDEIRANISELSPA